MRILLVCVNEVIFNIRYNVEKYKINVKNWNYEWWREELIIRLLFLLCLFW